MNHKKLEILIFLSLIIAFLFVSCKKVLAGCEYQYDYTYGSCDTNSGCSKNCNCDAYSDYGAIKSIGLGQCYDYGGGKKYCLYQSWSNSTCLPQDCGCGGVPTGPPTCTLSGPSQINIHETGSFTANATGTGNTVKLIQIWRAPATGSRPTSDRWVKIGEVVNADGVSSLTANWTTQDSDITADAGNKWQVFCNAYYSTVQVPGTADDRCTGDPWGVVSSYADCGTSDSILNSITGWVQGRVSTNGTTPYWKSGSCAGCSGSCSIAPSLAISCNSRAQNFGCNLSGAKYDEGGFKFDVGTSGFCAASEPPSGYEFTGWSVTNSRPGNPDVSGSCSGIYCNASFTLWGSSSGNNDVWFSVAPVCPAAQSCPTTCHTNNYWITNGNGDCTDRYCPANAPAAQSCAACHTNNYTITNGNGDCTDRYCPANAPAAQSCAACHTNNYWITNGNGDCTDRYCPANAPAYQACPTTCHTDYQYPPDGACKTHECPPTPPLADPTCVSASCTVASAPGEPATCTVDWSNVSGAVSYAVRVDDWANAWSNTCAWTYPGDICVDGLAYSIHSFNGKGGYTYNPWFHAIDGCGRWYYGSCPVFTAPACPAVPTGLTATRNGCDVTLNWTDNSNNEESFMIQRALDSGAFADWRSVAAGGTTTTDSGVFCGANPAASVRYRISAINTTLGCPRVYSNEATQSCPLNETSTFLTIVPDPPPDIVMAKTVNPYFRYDVVPQCGTFDHIEFSFDPTRLTNVTPTSSTSEPGTVSVTAGMTPGNTIITARVYLKPGPVLALTKEIPVEVIPPDPWWQTQDGDVHANVSITSLMPAIATVDKYLSLKGAGGMPGVVSWNSVNPPELDAGSISETNWQAKKTYSGDRVDFDYLLNRLNVDTSKTFTPPSLPDTGIYYLSGSATLDGGNLGTKKIIIFVGGDGNVTVQGNITVDNGGFFALIAKGSLTFASAVTDAQGFYLSSGAMSVAAGTQLFEGEGSFIGWGGVTMGRDLGASSLNLTPSEFFLFRPDLLINAPKEFLFTPFVFQEVAP